MMLFNEPRSAGGVNHFYVIQISHLALGNLVKLVKHQFSHLRMEVLQILLYFWLYVADNVVIIGVGFIQNSPSERLRADKTSSF